jgi:hypothetical protein
MVWSFEKRATIRNAHELGVYLVKAQLKGYNAKQGTTVKNPIF